MKLFYLKITLIFSLLISNYSFTQSKTEIDKKAKELENLCRKNSRIPDSLGFYGKKLLDFGKEHNHLKATIEGYFALGFSASLKSEKDLAIIYFDSSLLYKDKASEKYFSEVMRIMRNKAIILDKTNKIDEAIEVYNEIIAQCKSRNKMSDIAFVYNNLGIINKNEGNLNKALEYYKDAINIWDSIGNEAPKTTLYMNIGLAQIDLRNYKQSTLSYHKGLAIAKKYKNNRDIYKFYNNLSVNHRDQRQFDSAHYYLNILTKHYKKNGLSEPEHLGYMNIGNTYYQARELDSAFKYLNKSLIGLKKTNSEKKIAENYRLLSYLYLDKNNTAKSKAYLDSSYALNLKNNFKLTLARDYKQYARIYEKLNDFKKANEYYKLEKQINDSIYQTKTAKDYNELLVSQNVKEHKSLIEKLSNSISNYKLKLVLAFIVLGVISLFSFFQLKRHKKAKKDTKNLQLKLDKLISEKKKIEKEEVKKALDKGDFITLKSKAVLNLNDIMYIKSDGHYVEFYLKNSNKPEIDRNSMTNTLSVLPATQFIRIHKSYILNINYLKIINSTKLMLENGTWLNLSRTYKPQLKSLLNKD